MLWMSVCYRAATGFLRNLSVKCQPPKKAGRLAREALAQGKLLPTLKEWPG